MQRAGMLMAVLLALALVGCQTPGQFRAGVAMMNIAAESAYDLAYGMWLDDLIDTPTAARAAALYDRYFDAANALLDVVLEWEAAPVPQPWTPARVIQARQRATALLMSLEALVAEIRRARDSPEPVEPSPPVRPSAFTTDRKRGRACTWQRAA